MRAVGVDIGTGFITSAETEEDKIVYRKIRDAFFRVNPNKFLSGTVMGFGEEMLKRSGAHFVKVNNEIFILGDDAFKFATMFHQECLRPMAKGVLNPREQVAGMMVGELVKAIVGEPQSDDDVLYFCVPAEPIDEEFDVTYHRELLRGMFEELGYHNVEVMTEGLAVVYSELKENAYTGIGMSFGAGMCNVAYVNLGMPVFAFSLGRGGDWIDQSAATQIDETANVVAVVKEKMERLMTPNGQIEQAVSIYYDALLKYVVERFNDLYERTPRKQLPNVVEPIPLVVSGGTSMIGGFVGRLKAIMDDVGFPVPVSQVILAEEPLYAVSRGLYEAAEISASHQE